MHPADQFEAFHALADAGASPHRGLGVSENVVAKRLRLGHLSPVILKAYRDDEIGLEQAQAFAVSDDQTAQERVFADLTAYNRRPDIIRRALTQGEVPTSDKRVIFVGVEAYSQAGGAIRQDLFGEEGSGFLLDPALLDRLVAEKLETIRAGIEAEGWLWVDAIADLDYQQLSQFVRRHPERVELTKKTGKSLVASPTNMTRWSTMTMPISIGCRNSNSVSMSWACFHNAGPLRP